MREGGGGGVYRFHKSNSDPVKSPNKVVPKVSWGHRDIFGGKLGRVTRTDSPAHRCTHGDAAAFHRFVSGSLAPGVRPGTRWRGGRRGPPTGLDRHGVVDRDFGQIQRIWRDSENVMFCSSAGNKGSALFLQSLC